MKVADSRKLRILFLAADKFPPFRVDVSVLFGKEIVGRGHTIDWLLQSDKPLDHSIETSWEGGRAIVGRTDTGATLWGRIKKHIFNIFNDCKMFRLMAQNPYDLVIVKDKFIAAVMAVLASKMFNTRFVYWFSFPFDEDDIFKVKEKTVRYPLIYLLRGILFRNLLYRMIIPGCDHALVQTEYMKANMVAKGVSSLKMTAVPMAVCINDVPFIGHIRKINKNERPTIVYLGTLIKIRRMDFLLRSFKMVLNQIPNAILFLVGGSDVKTDEDELLYEAERLGISDAVTITGFLPQQQAWTYVAQAHVCVSPIYPSPIFDVGSPTKLLEYMAVGKAAVANDQPEQLAVIEESKAGICVMYDEKEFSNAIIHLIKNQNIAQEMGVRGRKYIETKRNYKQTADFVEQKLLKIAF